MRKARHPHHHHHTNPDAIRARDAVDGLWRLFEDWARHYARINGLDVDQVIASVATRHQQLSRKMPKN